MSDDIKNIIENIELEELFDAGVVYTRTLKNGEEKEYIRPKSADEREDFNEYYREYRNKNREKYREYMREYMRIYRQKKRGTDN